MTIHNNRPDLFIKSEYNIWLDPYIQQRMLEAHLNPQSDGASRNKESVKRTIEFLKSHITSNSSILDLGCGPGLYAEQLSDAGYKITGIDFNNASVEYARKRRNDIRHIAGNYITDFPIGNYDAAILIYCDFGALTDSEGKQLLENVYDSLEEGGVFIFDFFDTRILDSKKEGKDWEFTPDGGFWSGNEYLLLSQTFHYPENNVFAYQYNLIEQSGSKHFIVWERYFEKKQILELLKNIGFINIEFYENVCMNNNFTCSDEVFVVARK